MTNRSGVLLDLDGTLLDTAPDLAGAVNVLRRERGQPPMTLARLRPKASYGARGMIGEGLGLTPDDADYADCHARFMALYRERLTADTQPFPGMREALAELGRRGVPWGVVTNKPEALAVPLVEAMGFDPAPACIIGGDTAGVAKPDPAPVLLGCERAGVAAPRSFYVGDSARDITAGRNAGLRTVAVTYGYFEADEDLAAWGADQVIERAADLVETIMRDLESATRV